MGYVGYVGIGLTRVSPLGPAGVCLAAKRVAAHRRVFNAKVSMRKAR